MNHAVTVIGAGLSGLTVAYRLLQKGIDVHVYEARPRVGGRILTANLNDTIVELGAQNILDGGKAENLLNLIADMQLTTVSGKMRLQIHYDNGTKLIATDQLLNQWLSKTPKDQLEQQIDDLATRSQNMAQILQSLFASHPDLYALFAIRLMGYEGLPVHELSPRYVKTLKNMLFNRLNRSDQNGHTYFQHMTIQGGMALLTETLKKKLGDCIHLASPLKSLTKTHQKSYVLGFENGQTIEAERVVLTMPCSVYQDVCIQGEDQLLSRLQDIKTVGYGKHAKLLVPVSKPEEFEGSFANDRFFAFSMNQNIVTMYYLNEHVSFTPSTIQQVFERDRPILELVYRDQSLSQLQAEYARCEQFSSYPGPVGYNWYDDPYSRGTYSCMVAGHEEVFTATTEYHGEQVKQLFSPIDDRLFFAGEHTSVLMDVAGTMETAVEAGERTARMCLR